MTEDLDRPNPYRPSEDVKGGTDLPTVNGPPKASPWAVAGTLLLSLVSGFFAFGITCFGSFVVLPRDWGGTFIVAMVAALGVGVALAIFLFRAIEKDRQASVENENQ